MLHPAKGTVQRESRDGGLASSVRLKILVHSVSLEYESIPHVECAFEIHVLACSACLYNFTHINASVCGANFDGVDANFHTL